MLNKLKQLQKKEDLTVYEMATILRIPENSLYNYYSGRRTPPASALALIELTLIIFDRKKITKEDLLARTGRTFPQTGENNA